MTNIQPFCLVTWYVHRTMKELFAYKYNKIGHVNSLNVLFFMSDNKLLVLGLIYLFFISRQAKYISGNSIPNL